jgi:hypothetical protein
MYILLKCMDPVLFKKASPMKLICSAIGIQKLFFFDKKYIIPITAPSLFDDFH